MATDGAMPEPGGSDPFGEGVRRREQLRKILTAQHEIFMNIVMYDPPGTDLNLKRLLEERNGLIIAASGDYRNWLAQHPAAHIGDPRAVDVADLTCEDR